VLAEKLIKVLREHMEQVAAVAAAVLLAPQVIAEAMEEVEPSSFDGLPL
jgi:hypothetical protein